MNSGETQMEKLSEWIPFAGNQEAPLRILLLEDLRSDAEVIALQLRKLQYERDIQVVTNRNDFVASLEAFNPHIVLSDYSLPQYTGMDALMHVRERYPYLPFIICTGSMNEETAVACIKAGADDYVLKDSLGRLCSAVQSALVAKQNLHEKDRAVAELQESEANIRAIATHAPDTIYKVDPSGTIVFSSRPFDPKENWGEPGGLITDMVREAERDRLREALVRSLSNTETASLELRANTSDDNERWLMFRIGPVTGGSPRALVCIVNDVSSRVFAERETRELNAQLITLTKYLEQVREDEKERIAIEIHDQLGQELTGTKLALYWMRQQLQSPDLEVKRDELLEKVSHLINLTTTTIETVRRIAHELRPVVLDNMGLQAALEWHVENHNKSAGAPCSLHVDIGDLHFDKDFSTSIYRIVQEALTNVNKHAEATKAWVDFIVEDDELLLQIRDNGKGLDTSSAMKSSSLGLFGIRERIRPWDGHFELQSTPEKGSTLRVVFKRTTVAKKPALLNPETHH